MVETTHMLATCGLHFYHSCSCVNGNFEIHNVMIDDNSHYDQKKIEVIKTTKGDYITHEKFEAHTYKCTSDSGSLMVFTKGVRGGKFYEDDTFRLEKKLV